MIKRIRNTHMVFGKPWKMWKKHRDIKLVTTEARTNYLVSEPNYHTTRFFSENLLAVEIHTADTCRHCKRC